MLIKKHPIAKWVSPLPPYKIAWLSDDKSYIHIRMQWWFGNDDKVLKLAGIEEIEVDQGGIMRQLFNYGSLIFKAEGEIKERIDWVINPKQYENLIENVET